jgi:hypothetical protein
MMQAWLSPDEEAAARLGAQFNYGVYEKNTWVDWSDGMAKTVCLPQAPTWIVRLIPGVFFSGFPGPIKNTLWMVVRQATGHSDVLGTFPTEFAFGTHELHTLHPDSEMIYGRNIEGFKPFHGSELAPGNLCRIGINI